MKTTLKYLATILFFAAASAGCRAGRASVEKDHFGVTAAGDSVTLYRLVNSGGACMEVLDYGGHVVRIVVPDREGRMDNIALGYGSIAEYETGKGYVGALLGRYANRITDGVFEIDGTPFRVTANETIAGKPGHLHGGREGFNRKMWRAETGAGTDRAFVRLTRTSPDGEEGFPGNLNCEVTYTWDDSNTWRMDYRAVTDAPTIVNMSHHCYFNLRAKGSVLGHYCRIHSDSVCVNNERYVPCRVESVADGPLDFREFHRFDERIDTPNEHMKRMGGYSADWILRGYDGSLREAATLYDPETGRSVEVWTTEPGLLIFTGIGLGQPFSNHGGFILETLHHPDTPKNPHFPSCVLRPGEVYRSTTEYRFATI